jgi:dTDP-4-dehydrorhamnose 3,5-epimerase
MDVSTTSIEGLLLFTPTPFADDRGWFTRTFDGEVARAHGVDPDAFVQDSQSRSRRGVIRGMHVRAGRGEAKHVRCASGRVLDVVVDLRVDSPTFLVQETFELDDVTHAAIYVPPHCAHGWQALSEPADVCYRIDQLHDPSEDVSIRYDDPDLAIAWPDPGGMISPRDLAAGTLEEALAALAARPPV